MTQGEYLYERAAVDTGGLPPLWHIDNGRALFAGPLGHNARHRHSAPVYLAGLYGTFGLRIDDGAWLSCRTAVIPAGVPYEFDMSGNPLAVLYVEPNVAGVDALTPLVRSTREVNGALVGSAGEVSLMRELYEDRFGAQWTGVALNDIVDFSKRRGAREIDPRVLASSKQCMNVTTSWCPWHGLPARWVYLLHGSSTCSRRKLAFHSGAIARGIDCARRYARSSTGAISRKEHTRLVFSTRRISPAISAGRLVRPPPRAYRGYG